jgi:hypothetical protein
LGGPILLSLVLALTFIPTATAYQALANFRDAVRRLGATAAHAEDLYPYALALHDYKVKLFPQYRDPKCVIPPWTPPTTTG